MKKLLTNSVLITFMICMFSTKLYAQCSEASGWFFLSHTQKLTGKWSYMMDVQLRSSTQFKYLQNVLVRPGLLYQLTDQQSVGVGYTYFVTWDRSEGTETFEPENRIFEQYIHRLKIGRLIVNNRFRLEQRFIQNEENNVFSQRIRHQLQARFHLNSDKEFENGLYINLQNEIFLNVQNQDKVNDHFFDQNRPYLGLGYRINKKLEIELGYYHRYQIKEDSRLNENIFQLMVVTDL
jgi:hypothetical protein